MVHYQKSSPLTQNWCWWLFPPCSCLLESQPLILTLYLTSWGNLEVQTLLKVICIFHKGTPISIIQSLIKTQPGTRPRTDPWKAEETENLTTNWLLNNIKFIPTEFASLYGSRASWHPSLWSGWWSAESCSCRHLPVIQEEKNTSLCAQHCPPSTTCTCLGQGLRPVKSLHHSREQKALLCVC